MLLSFKVKNYLSFKDEAWFSLEANKKIRTLPENKNIIKMKDWENIWLNKTAVFYGANASWKTNILKWLAFLKDITLSSFSYPIEWWIRNLFLSPFLLDDNKKNEPIKFEIEFLLEKFRYKYILELTYKEIFNEKLSIFNKNKEKILINRKEDIFIEEWFFWYTNEQINSEVTDLYPRNNQTFISVLANRDSKWKYLATKIVKFFMWINFIDSKANFTWMTMSMLKDDNIKDRILSFINNADINIKDIIQEEKEVEISKDINFWFIEVNWQKIHPQKVINQKLDFIHPIYKDWKQVWNTKFDFLRQESQWTQTLFSFLGPILDTIKSNWILLIDEIDTHMHFLLIENLIKFFHWIDNESKNNIWDSQFIFNTHNLDLMDLELFRKDQIYFTSKDFYWATEIYSLDDFKDIQIRNNSDIKKAYKLWIFGAVPILSDFNL